MSNQASTTLIVRGMTCGSCVRHVGNALRKIEGVEGVKVDLERGRAEVAHAEGLSTAVLIEAIEAEGYSAALGVGITP